MTKKASTPALRFKGFTYTWEQRRLGEVLSLIKDGTHGTHQDVEDGPLLLSAKNIKHGEIRWDNTDRRIAQADYEKIHSTFSLENGDILLTIVGSIGEVAILRNSDGITFQRSVAFLRPNKELKSEFLYAEVLSEHFQKELDNRKSTSAQPGIYLGDLGEIPFTFPKDIAEQKQIGTYFRNLDRLITLHQRKYDKLTNMKKSMLEKMFPNNGANVPEIRFKGFTDAWEQRKLGECTDLLTGHPFESKQFSENGVLLIRGMNVKRNELDTSPEICEYWHTTEGLEKYLLSADDILIQMDGALIGKSYAKMPKNKLPALLVQRVTRARTKNDYDNDFIYQSLQRDFLTYIQGIKTETAEPHLSLNDIFIFKIYVPSLAEQKKIGSCFRNLDNLITLHQRELEKLKNLKKACLEKMFV